VNRRDFIKLATAEHRKWRKLVPVAVPLSEGVTPTSDGITKPEWVAVDEETRALIFANLNGESSG
jgi:hypothetical protein